VTIENKEKDNKQKTFSDLVGMENNRKDRKPYSLVTRQKSKGSIEETTKIATAVVENEKSKIFINNNARIKNL